MPHTLAKLHAAYYRDKKVLVTGGAGFIGSHLVDRLAGYGAQVTVLDNLSTGRIDNLATYATTINLIIGSIENEAICRKATAGISHLFHLAAMVSVSESCHKPERCSAINVDGTATLYKAAHASGAKHVVFSSSAAVYGPSETACDEAQPLNPISPYAVSKRAGEQLGVALAQQSDISVANLRYFNVHGPRQLATSPYSGVVAAFTHRLKNKQPITIYGDGNQTRDFIPVDQVVTANLHAGLCTPLRGQSINVAAGTSISLKELLSQLESDLSCTATSVEYQAARNGDITHSTAAIDRLSKMLTYRP